MSLEFLALEERKVLLKEAYDEAMSIVSKDWDEKWIYVVPGSDLLDKICQRFGFRYYKSKDGKVLAAHISEVDDEIKNLIEEICS
jgi:hypothetical protein